jgi:hypothetical protein
MRAFLLISCAALGVAACGGGNDAEDANLAADANMMIDENVAMDPALNGDANLAMGADPATQNLVNQDLATNDADANLANGL